MLGNHSYILYLGAVCRHSINVSDISNPLRLALLSQFIHVRNRTESRSPIALSRGRKPTFSSRQTTRFLCGPPDFPSCSFQLLLPVNYAVSLPLSSLAAVFSIADREFAFPDSGHYCPHCLLLRSVVEAWSVSSSSRKFTCVLTANKEPSHLRHSCVRIISNTFPVLLM